MRAINPNIHIQYKVSANTNVFRHTHTHIDLRKHISARAKKDRERESKISNTVSMGLCGTGMERSWSENYIKTCMHICNMYYSNIPPAPFSLPMMIHHGDVKCVSKV